MTRSGRVCNEEARLARPSRIRPGWRHSSTPSGLDHRSLEDCVIHRICERLDHDRTCRPLPPHLQRMLARPAGMGRHPARRHPGLLRPRPGLLTASSMPVLYFKGFHAIQTHRLAHWLWTQGRTDFALYLQSRSSAVFQTDINPACPDRQGHLPRPCHRAGGRRDRRHRGRCLDPARRDARRHRQGRHRSPSEDPLRRADRRRRQDPRQYRDRPLLARSPPVRWCWRFRTTRLSPASRPRWSGRRAAPSRRAQMDQVNVEQVVLDQVMGAGI